MRELFDVPNLDGLSISPDDLHDAAHVLDILARYARSKARAMEFRLSGNVNPALRIERHMEELYGSLPEWARW